MKNQPDTTKNCNLNPKVLHIIGRPDGGGAELLVRELVSRLPEYGFDSKAIYFQNPNRVKLTDRESSLDLHKVRSINGVRAIVGALKREIALSDNLLIHGHLTDSLYTLGAIFRRLDSPVLFTEHNTYNKRREHKWMRPLESWIYNAFSNVVCISDAVEQSLSSWLDGEFSTIPNNRIVIENGARLFSHVARPPIRENSVKLLSIGSLEHQKGFEFSIHAAALLRDEISEYTILGEGSQKQALKDLAEQLAIHDKVKFPGFTEDPSPYFADSDVFLIPSRWEGFGLVSIEALSTGMPLVASNVPGLRDIVSSCTCTELVQAENSEALASGIRKILARARAGECPAEIARQHAEKYSLDAMAYKYAKLYRKVMKIQ